MKRKSELIEGLADWASRLRRPDHFLRDEDNSFRTPEEKLGIKILCCRTNTELTATEFEVHYEAFYRISVEGLRYFLPRVLLLDIGNKRGRLRTIELTPYTYLLDGGPDDPWPSGSLDLLRLMSQEERDLLCDFFDYEERYFWLKRERQANWSRAKKIRALFGS